jgi:phosphoserine phosphatase RsbU/P
MQAMLRMAFRMGADLETAFRQANNQLAGYLPEDRFVTAFIGLLDAAAHRMRFHSGGQAPILLYESRTRECRRYKPTSFPLAAMPLKSLKPATEVDMQPGDILALLSDGIYEYRNAGGEEFGELRVEALLARHHELRAAELAAKILGAVQAFAGNAMQEDDMTVVLVKRRAAE